MFRLIFAIATPIGSCGMTIGSERRFDFAREVSGEIAIELLAELFADDVADLRTKKSLIPERCLSSGVQ